MSTVDAVSKPVTDAVTAAPLKKPAQVESGRPGRTFPWGGAALFAGTTVAILVAAFYDRGGLQMERNAYLEIGLTLVSSVLASVALIRVPIGGSNRFYGSWSALLFAGLAAFTCFSIHWSLDPGESLLESSRTVTYLAIFVAAIALVRLAPRRWEAVLGGIAVGCLMICCWSLLTKIFPSAFAPDETFARLRAPFDYWNSVGLMAAFGVLAFLWFAVRPNGYGLINALAYPGILISVVCLMLSYSRGAVLALVAGLGIWFVFAGMRLRSALVLFAVGIPTAAITTWVFENDALTSDRIILLVRNEVGHRFGLLMGISILAVFLAGIAINFFLAVKTPTSPRVKTIIGIAAIATAALIPLGALGAIASSPKGLSGQTKITWDQLTSPKAITPSNSPYRLTSAASVRARYWREGLKIYADNKLVGSGAGAYVTARTRFRTEPIGVRHAHGYIVQTLADLGLVGVGISLLLGLTWLITIARNLGGWRRQQIEQLTSAQKLERTGLIAMLGIVAVFVVHSLVDWTWFVPANVLICALCAGWLAGRGPVRDLLEQSKTNASADSPTEVSKRRILKMVPRYFAAAVVTTTALAASWLAFQPVSAVNAGDLSTKRIEKGNLEGAESAANVAVKRNPLSADPLWQLAFVQDARGKHLDSVKTLEKATKLQPANAETWRRLGRYQLSVLQEPEKALKSFKTADYLDPLSPTSKADLAEATAAIEAQNSVLPFEQTDETPLPGELQEPLDGSAEPNTGGSQTLPSTPEPPEPQAKPKSRALPQLSESRAY